MSELSTGTLVRSIIATPTVSTTPAYTANDQVGGIMTLTGMIGDLDRMVRLQSLSVVDAGLQSAALTLFFFSQLPTVGSSDNVAISITDANMLFCLGTVQVAATDYQTTALNSVATVKAIGLDMKCTELAADVSTLTNKLYCVVKTTGTPTYVSTTDLQFRFSFEQ